MDFKQNAESEEERSLKHALSECKLRVQHLLLQKERHEKDYAALIKQKRDYRYENIAWTLVLLGALAVRWGLGYFRRLPTGSMLIPFQIGMNLVCVFLLGRVIYMARHYFGMRDYKRAKFILFRTLLEDEELAKNNVERLLVKARQELEQLQTQAEAMKAEEEPEAENEERMILRWDQQEEENQGTQKEQSGDLSDTARLIKEALKE